MARIDSIGELDSDDLWRSNSPKQTDCRILLLFVANGADPLVASYLIKKIPRIRNSNLITITRILPFFSDLPGVLRNQFLPTDKHFEIVGILLVGFGGSIYCPMQTYEEIEKSLKEIEQSPLFIGVLDSTRPAHPIVFNHTHFVRWRLFVDDTVPFAGSTECAITLEQCNLVTTSQLRRHRYPPPWIGLPLSFLLSSIVSSVSIGEYYLFQWLCSVGIAKHTILNNLTSPEQQTLMSEIELKIRDSRKYDGLHGRVIKANEVDFPFLYATGWNLSKVVRYSTMLYSRGFHLLSKPSAYQLDEVSRIRDMCRISKEEFSEPVCKLKRRRLDDILSHINRLANREHGLDLNTTVLRLKTGELGEMVNSLLATFLIALTSEDQQDPSQTRRHCPITFELIEYLQNVALNSEDIRRFFSQSALLGKLANRNADEVIRRCSESPLGGKKSNLIVLLFKDVDPFMTHPHVLQMTASVYSDRHQVLKHQSARLPVLIAVLRKVDKEALLFGFTPHIEEEQAPWHCDRSLEGILANCAKDNPSDLRMDDLWPGMVHIVKRDRGRSIEKYLVKVISLYRERNRMRVEGVGEEEDLDGGLDVAEDDENEETTLSSQHVQNLVADEKGDEEEDTESFQHGDIHQDDVDFAL